MTELMAAYEIDLEAGSMGKLKNLIPGLLVQKGWQIKKFVALCMLEGLSEQTAYRMARGEVTQFTTNTLLIAAEVLGVKSICELIDLED